MARSDYGKRWSFLGLLPMFDPPREDAADTIAQTKDHGVEVKMVTGDNTAIAREIATTLGMGRNILPADELVEQAGGKNLDDRTAKGLEKPAPILLAAIMGTQIVAALIAAFGWFVTPIPWTYIGLIWAYCIVWIFIEDGLKLMVYRHM